MSFNRMTYFGDDLSGVSIGVYDNKATVTALDKIIPVFQNYQLTLGL